MSKYQLLKALKITYKHIDEIAGKEVSLSLRQLTIDWVTTGNNKGKDDE